MMKTAMTTTLALLATAAWGQAGGRPPGAIIIKAGPSAEDKVLATPLAPSAYEWKRGMGPVQLPRVATHICLLTQISGNFAGAGERVALYVDNGATGGARYMLNGTSGQNELLANVACAERAKFVPAGPLSVAGYGNHMTGSCTPHVVAMPDVGLGKAYFVSGMSGKWRGAGESVAVVPGLFKTSIRVTGCSGNADGTLMSIGFGKAVKYRTTSGITTVPKDATTAIGMQGNDTGNFLDSLAGIRGTYGGIDTKVSWLAPVDEALCGIVAIAGKLQGYGEQAGVAPEKNADGRWWWRVSVSNQAQVYNLSVGARCIARDQR